MDAFAVCEMVGIDHPSRLSFDELQDWRAYFVAKERYKDGPPMSAKEIRAAMET